MPEVSDIFADSDRLNLDEELTNPVTQPNEAMVAAGAGQPSNVFGVGRLTDDAGDPLRATYYDQQAEIRPDEESDGLTIPDTNIPLYAFPLVGEIVSVHSNTYTYTARAYINPSVVAQDQAPLIRLHDPTLVTLTMAEVGNSCLLIVTITGIVYLWQVPETWPTQVICT